MLKILLFIFTFFCNDLFANNKTGRISFGGGIHNFMKNGILRCEGSGGCDTSKGAPAPINYKSMSTLYSFEYFTKQNFMKILKPFVGFNGTDKEAYYGYFGFSADLFFGNCKCVIVTPSLAAGWYVDGDEIKLGNRVEFRSGGDLYYKFRNNVRIGVGVYHISNAGIGDNNPGTEQVVLKYQIPF